jgi:hypothetical protein
MTLLLLSGCFEKDYDLIERVSIDMTVVISSAALTQ